MRIKKIDICIKVVCNHYCFYNFILLREIVSLCFQHVIYCWLKKKMYIKFEYMYLNNITYTSGPYYRKKKIKTDAIIN